MSDQELLETVAELLGLPVEDIVDKVDTHKRSAISRVYAKTRPYWLRNGKALVLSAGDKVINLQAKFSDFWQLRFFYTADGTPVTYEPEELFRAAHGSNAGDNGNVSEYTTPSQYEVEFYPPSIGETIYTSFWMRPALGTIADIPEEWHYVIQDYIMAMMKPGSYPMSLFIDGLKDIGSMARPSVEESTEWGPSPDQDALPTAMALYER